MAEVRAFPVGCLFWGAVSVLMFAAGEAHASKPVPQYEPCAFAAEASVVVRGEVSGVRLAEVQFWPKPRLWWRARVQPVALIKGGPLPPPEEMNFTDDHKSERGDLVEQAFMKDAYGWWLLEQQPAKRCRW